MEWNFGGLPVELTEEATAAFGVVPVPLEKTVSYGQGAAAGPAAIVEASRYMELYDEVFHCEPADDGIWTSPPLELENETIDGAVHLIYTKVKELLHTSRFHVFLGGEHSLTPPIVRAYRERYADLTVLQLDAHADLRMEYEGSQYSHASAMRRVLEICPAVQVGIRSMSREEAQALPGLHTTLVTAHRFFRDRAAALREIVDRLSDHVYITLDVDGLDPSLLPCTGTPEPGGLFWNDVMEVLEAVFSRKTVVGADINELAPVEGFPASDFTAAKLAYKLMVMKRHFAH